MGFAFNTTRSGNEGMYIFSRGNTGKEVVQCNAMCVCVL
jgi:hypothetical protein